MMVGSVNESSMLRSIYASLMGLFLFLCLAPAGLRAQIAEGAIGGVVTDPGDAAVAGSLVTATNVDTGVESQATTNSTGYYLFPVLSAGTYTVAVEQEGFQRATTTSLELHAGEKLRVDLSLVLGQVTESVQVVATAPLVNATTTDLGTVIESRQISELPLNGRNFTQLLALQPGWAPGEANGGVSLNGLSGWANNWLMDGVDMSFGENNGIGAASTGFNGYLISYLSVDAIQELKATSGAASAEYSRASGGTINVTTKSGTNKFHGTAWEYLRNDALNTNAFFANANSIEKPPLRQNQFGGNIGGPILSNRLFFFFNYEGARVKKSSVINTTVPTEALYSQMTNPKMVTYLKRWLDPPRAPTSDPNWGFHSHLGGANAVEDTSLTRIDANLGKHRLTFRMAYGNQDSSIGQTSPHYEWGYPLPTRNYLGSWTNVISPTVVNTFRVSSNINPVRRHGYAIGKNAELNQDLPGVGAFTLDPEFPGIAFYTPGVGGLAPGDATAIDAPTKTIADDLTWIHGAHEVKAGFNLRYTSAFRLQYGQGVWYEYFSEPALLNDEVDAIELDIGNPGRALKFWTYAGYIQDNWKINRRLSLNYGLHYDYFEPITGPMGLATDDPYGPLSPLGSPLWKPNKANFSPRLGIVYGLTDDGKTVLRAGAGSYYGAPQPYFYMNGPMIGPGVPTFPVMRAEDFPPDMDISFPNVNWHFVENLRNDPSQIPEGFTAGYYVPWLDQPDEYSLQYNFTLEREVSPTLVASASYVGNRVLNVVNTRILNLPDATGARVHSEIGPVTAIENAARRWNNQLQLSVRKRASRGFSFDVFYTWASSMLYYGASVQDYSNIAGSTGPASGHVRHRLNMDYIWAIPSGNWVKKSAFTRAVLDGWSLTGIIGASTGGAFNIVTCVDAVGNGLPCNQRPDAVSGVSPYMNGPDRLQFLNPAAFDSATPLAESRFGNLGYNSANGPGAFTWDMGVRKSWRFHESHELSFRCEMFNWMNHTVFANPTPYTVSAAFGRILAERSAGRQLQLALRYSF